MTKFVVLRIANGNYDQGFPVTLQIREEVGSNLAEALGCLPAATKIPQLYNHWQSDYENLKLVFRAIKTKKGKSFSTANLPQQCRQSANNFINYVKNWLNSENRDLQKIRNTLFKHLPDKHEEIRVFIQTKDPLLKKLPWNEWDIFADIYTKAEIALIPPEYSRVKVSVAATEREQMRILAILGNDTGIDTQADKDEIKGLPSVEPIFLSQPKPEELYQQLRNELGWDILFFAGHSSSLKSGETGTIDINLQDKITIDEFKIALNKAIEQGLQLAIFNSCDGLGLAKQLADLNIPQVIVMREPVPDEAAQKFVKNFLKAFSNGQSLYLAMREARESLECFERDYPGVMWLPVICQNPAQGSATWPKIPVRKKAPLTSLDWLEEVESETWQCIHTLTAHSDAVKSVAISPDGKILASGSLDQTIKLWDLVTGELLNTLTAHKGSVTCVTFSRDGQTLASSSAQPDGTIKLWHPGTGELKGSLRGTDWIVLTIWEIVISPDGKTLVSAHHVDSTVKVWNLVTGGLSRTLRGHVWAVKSVAISPDGKTLVSGSMDSNIKIWNLNIGRLIRNLNGPSGLFSPVQSWFSDKSVYSVAFSPDGQTLASGGVNQPVQLWRLSNGELKSSLTGHSDDVYSVAFSPDGKRLASGSADRTIRIWDLFTGEPIHTLGHSDAVYSVAFSPDGKTLVSSSKDSTVKIWRVIH